MNRRLSLIGVLVLVMGGGLSIGFLARPAEWYLQLNKPPFNPPGFVFAPVWTALYVLIAIAGWRTWTRDRKDPAMLFWAAQMALNFVWSPLFFRAHLIGVALAVVLAMLACIVAFIVRSWSRDRTAAWLFVPYAAWVSFASLLNASILILN